MSRALVAQEVSSAELLDRTFASIDSSEQEFRAFVSLADRDALREQARQIDSDRAGGADVPALAGIPIAVKDNIAVLGERLTCGSRMLENYRVPYNATVTDRLNAQRLLIVGKTNMDEFGFGSSTENSAFGPTRNPRALDRVPGGSSGGSAAAVAVGHVPWALVTDTGGSVRQPAALCGVVGARPSYGRVSRYGLVSYGSSMDQVGPLANTVEDVSLLLSVIAGRDPRDSTTIHESFELLTGTPDTLRVGIPAEYLDDRCQPEVLAAMEQAKQWLSSAGWKTESVSLPSTEYALETYYIVASVEAASNLARFDGVKYGYRAREDASLEKMTTATRTEAFGAEAKRRIMLGTFASSAGYADKYYEKAYAARELLRDDFTRVFADVDVILAPVSPTTAWPLGAKTKDPMTMYLSDIYTVPAALGGIPAITVPVGKDNAGLPIGLQIYAPYRGDALALAAAARLEQLAAQAGAI